MQLNLRERNDMALRYLEQGQDELFIDTIKQVVTNELPKKEYDNEQDISLKVQILNNIAAYYLDLSTKINDKKEKQDLIDQVTQYINKSDRININESISFSLKGFLLYFNSDFKKSRQFYKLSEYFSQSQEFDNGNLVASIGRGILEYIQNNFQEAAESFKHIWRCNPNLTQCQITLAQIYFQQEKYDLSLAIFEKILKTDENVKALIGAAQIHYRQQNFDQYRQRLFQAFKLDQQDPQVLLLLAEYFFFKQDFEKMFELSKKTLNELQKWPRFEKSNFYSGYHETKSKICFYLGYYHQVKEYPNALKYYKEAIQLNPKNYQAQYNLSQIYTNEKNYVGALKCLETIQQSSFKHKECLRMLGYLHSKNQNREQSIYYYKQALQFDQDDYEILIEYANIQEQLDPQESLTSYEKAEEIMIKRQVLIHPELPNNIGVLRTKLGIQKKAEEAFIKALELNSDKSFKAQSIRCTINYNLANLYEEMCQFGQALELYKQISNENPYYIDAQLKIAYLAYQRGSYTKAYEILEKAIKIVEINKLRPDMAICLKSFILYESGDSGQAYQNLERLKRTFNMDDPFARVFSAKIEYINSTEYRSQQNSQFQILRKLIEQGKDILQKDEHNTMGACIIAVVMAELKYSKESKQIFNQLLESYPNNNFFLLNLAHLEFLSNNYESAVKIYKNYLQKYQKSDEFVSMCIVICYHQMNDWKNAISYMKKIVITNPDSLQHRFNLNIIIHQQSQFILDQKQREQSQTKNAIHNLQTIQQIYEHLYKNHNARNSRLLLERSEESKKKVISQFQMINLMERIRDLSENQYNFIGMNKNRYEKFLEQDKQQIYQKQSYNNKLIETLHNIQSKKQQEDLRKHQEQQKQIQIEQEMAKKNQEKAQQMAQQLIIQQQNNNKKQPRSKKKSQVMDDQEAYQSSEENPNDSVHDSEEEKYDFDMKKVDPEIEPNMIKKVIIFEKNIKRKRESEKKSEEPKRKKLKKMNQQEEEKNEGYFLILEDLLYDQIYNPDFLGDDQDLQSLSDN